ncbi:MAG: S8 family serine peptidase [bacterium]
MSKRTMLPLLAAALLTATAVAGQYTMGPARRFTPEPVADAHTIGFSSGLVIDTRRGEPALPDELRVTVTDGEAQYWIVQLEGPFNRQWFRQLERLGLEPFGYLPHYAVLCWMTPAEREQVAALPFVTWTGLFQPAYKLEPGLEAASGELRLVALLMPGSTVETAGTLAAQGAAIDLVVESPFGVTVEFHADARAIPALARRDEVLWLQLRTEPEFVNNNAQWVTQTGWRSSAPPDTSMAARNVWAHGIRGRGLVLSTTDSGLNTGHDMFRDPALSITPPGIWPDHRKVVAFKLYGTAAANESPYHGSHVNGTVAGNDSAVGGTSNYDGMAKDARLYFVDVSASGGSFILQTDLWALWDTTYAGRGLPDSLRPIVQHSGSWGWSNSSGTYLLQDASTDAFGWAHKDFLNLLAAGNESSTRRLRNPGIAKNVLTIGATQNGTSSNAIASFSSRGPTQDSRTKPNVVAPGVDLWSARNSPATNTYSQMSGTSMATPAANGAIGLMRQYLRDGYYPTGTPEPGNRITYISAALMRAMAMVSGDPNVGSFTVPDNNIGWGRVDADSVLHFPGQTRRLLLKDDTTGVATGEFKEQEFEVSSAIPLRAMLAWTDTAAAPNANPTLVNNLHLELTAPSGTQYRGNQFTSGQSTPNPTSWDNINVEEGFRVNSPETGVWTLRVYGQNVATAARQPFAWVVTGDIEPAAGARDVGVATIVAPAGQVDSGSVVVPRAVIANHGTGPETFDVEFAIAAWADTQAVTLAAGASDTVEFTDWTAGSVGWFEARVRTMLAGDENPANDVMADSFQVVPPTGIEGGGSLPRAFELARVQPNPTTGRALVRFALPKSSPAQVGVYAIDGTLVRMLVQGALQPGRYALAWDGSDAAGRQVGRGIYYVRLSAPGFTGVQKLVRVQ